MGKLRFSMGTLIGVVVAIGVGLGALKSANAWIADLTTAVVVGALLFAILGIAYSQGNVRRFWTGFAVFGWAFLVLNNAGFQQYVGSYMSANGVLRFLHSKMARAEAPTVTSDTISVWIRKGYPVWIDGDEAADEDAVDELMEKAASKKPGVAISVLSDDDTFASDVYKRLAATRAGQGGSPPRSARGGIAVRPAALLLRPDDRTFRRVGVPLLSLLFALIGGILARTCFPPKKE